jgi:hypothetical protein
MGRDVVVVETSVGGGVIWRGESEGAWALLSALLGVVKVYSEDPQSGGL